MKEIKTAEEVLTYHIQWQQSTVNTPDIYEGDPIINAMHEYASQFEPKWIPIVEDLPDDGQIVDVYHPADGRITNVKFHDGEIKLWIEPSKCFKGLDTQWINLTHWMPSPQPPTKDIEG